VRCASKSPGSTWKMSEKQKRCVFLKNIPIYIIMWYNVYIYKYIYHIYIYISYVYIYCHIYIWLYMCVNWSLKPLFYSWTHVSI
jgi:hypothetical protein